MTMLTEKELHDFVPPVIFEGGVHAYGFMIVELHKCPKCKKMMIRRDNSSTWYRSPFPRYANYDFSLQLKRAGWVLESSVMVDDEFICQECADAGKADFECFLCKERKPTDRIQERYGDPADFLCKDCYETVPAKVWDDTSDKLMDSHRYDYC
jgi:hypothetical protein